MTAIKKIFWASLAIKLLLAALIPLTNDEAYYWVWSLHPQLSYYDHPPMVAWLFSLGKIFGENGGLIRWPGVIVGHLALALWLRILQPYLNERQRKVWLLLALLSPLIGGSSLLVTPDLPLMFCYALMLFFVLQWRSNPTWGLALATGVTLGFGLTSKYMMILLPLSLLPWALLNKETRTLVLRHAHWLVLGALLGSMAVWVWNLQNDLASFKFQADHGLGRKWKPSWTLHYVGAQIGLVFPVILYWAAKSRGKLPSIFHYLAWVPLIFFFFTTFRGYVEANWPIVAYAPLFALAVSAYPENARSLQITGVIWGLVMAALATVIILEPDWARKTKIREFHQFDEVIEASRNLNPVYARSYQMAAKMHFELKRPIYKLKGFNRKDFYDYMDGSEPTAVEFYFIAEKGDKLPLPLTARGYRVLDKKVIDDRFDIWTVRTP